MELSDRLPVADALSSVSTSAPTIFSFLLDFQELDFLDFYEIIYTLYVLEVKTWLMSAQAEQQVAAQNVKHETRAKTWGVRAVLGTMTMGASPTPGLFAKQTTDEAEVGELIKRWAVGTVCTALRAGEES